MVKIMPLAILATLMLFTLFSNANERFAFPTHTVYKNSISPSKYSQSDLDNHVREYYHRWKKEFLIKEETLYRIATDKKDHSRTVSEAQGYGMIITVFFAGEDKEAREIFDGLFRFSKSNPSDICKDFMTWQVPAKKGESDSAFDGDADIAFALLLAHKQWGSKGTINYKKEALTIIDSLLKYTIGKDSSLPLLGDWVNPDGEKYNQYTTRSSDFLISHFKTFYKYTKNSRWLDVIAACQNALNSIQTLPQNKTSLVNDFIRYEKNKKTYLPTSRHFLENEDNSYYYNACRVPLRVGADALLNDDNNSKKILKKMIGWVQKSSQNDAKNIKSGYRLDGSVIGEYFSIVFAAPFGVAAKATLNQSFLDSIYETIKQRHENYYEDSVTLLSLLLISNNYWSP